jgi:hypothetical protein
MSLPALKLGGVVIPRLLAGAPELSVEGVEGASTVRMSLGALVKMTHWSGKARGSISGNGWMPPGLDGLDYSQVLELLCTQQEAVNTTATSIALPSTPRQDYAPWVIAHLGTETVKLPCTYVDGVATVAPLPGAELYTFCWLPMYQVFATKPPKGLSAGQNTHSWQLDWEQV